MHASLSRLLGYVVKATKGDEAPVFTTADLKEQLKLSAAVMTNWKKRGVSKEGALAAEKRWGCSASWVLTGAEADANSTPWPLKTLTYAEFVALPEAFHEAVEGFVRPLVKSLQTPTPVGFIPPEPASNRGRWVWVDNRLQDETDGSSDTDSERREDDAPPKSARNS